MTKMHQVLSKTDKISMQSLFEFKRIIGTRYLSFGPDSLSHSSSSIIEQLI